MAKKSQLHVKWTLLTARLNHISQKVNDEVAITETNATVYSQAVEKIEEEMRSVQEEYLQRVDPKNTETIINDCMVQETKILELKLKLQSAVAARHIDRSPSNFSTDTLTDVRLPLLELPTFHGDVTEWNTFADLFQAAVHSNIRLSDAQKLQYLKSSLRGEAAKLLKHIAVTETNYKEAWSLLQKRYENQRHIANTLAKNIIGLQERKKSIRELLDEFYESDRALKGVIGENSRWELLVTNILTNSLDTETLQAWELSLTTTEIPSLQTLLNFLEVRARALQSTVQRLPTKELRPRNQKCPECKEEHSIRNCPKYEKASVDSRRQMVGTHRLCYNCLSPQHTSVDCKASKCRKCHRNHHTTLHKEDANKGANLAAWTSLTEILLPTAQIYVQHNDKVEKVRALLDSGSQVNIVSSRLIRTMGLRGRKSTTVATTISGSCKLPDEVRLEVFKGQWRRGIRCYVSENFNVTLPSTKISIKNREYLEDLELADPDFDTPRRVDIILGNGVYSQLLEGEVRRKSQDLPVAQKTILGWTLSGQTEEHTSKPTSLCCQIEQLRKFWELEEVPASTIRTDEERKTEQHYLKTVERGSNGKYIVKYPFFQDPPPLGESKEQAISRFRRLEKQLIKRKSAREYGNVIREYLTLGHMQPIKREDENARAYYLPHHAVFKDSSTTKLRVVFDASAKTTTGRSLNETMMNGPKVQEDLFHILVRFQKHAIAISADIEKMYRQVQVHPEHQNYQRIVWRNSPREKLQEFKLTTVTFGMKASPFLATKTLERLAEDEGDFYPRAKSVLLHDFYVDDLLTGSDTRETATELCQDVDNLLRAGGFVLRKWRSNEESVVKGFCENSGQQNVIIGDEDEVKTLGLRWRPKEDIFFFKVQMQIRKRHTKRTLLSDISRIYDPLGWLAPLTINGKVLFQQLWRLPVSWDEELPKKTLSEWTSYCENFKLIEKIKIPRYLNHKRTDELTLCGFCDASEKAYGAVIYLRASQDGQFRTKLLVAKSKVTPLKPTTIPRLELCAAVLLAKLMKETQKALKLGIPAFYWTDSMVVLQWITNHPSRWKTFVAHRVVQIQECSEPGQWSHVQTKDNPADLISRGTSAAALETQELWWHGPHWLRQPLSMNKSLSTGPVLEERKIKPAVFSASRDNTHNIIHRFSNLDKLLRVTALIMRFSLKARKRETKAGPIQVSELKEALTRIIKRAQNDVFNAEIKALRDGKHISHKSQILQLSPFVDNQEILRIGGRLQNAPINFEQKHQILLPYDHHLTTLILDDIHQKNLHAAGQLMLSTLRQKYWLPKAKQAIRRFTHNCTTCVRQKAKISEQLMGQLPRQRVTPNRPFLQTGVDYCGPINCKQMIGRIRKGHKAYVAVFVCMCTKAIHLEAVPSLSMESFLSSFTRFTGRRGVPTDVYSDNGRNFVAANHHLKDLYEMLQDEANQSVIDKKLSAQGIQWHFIPPYSPHFGGLWEAGVKSLKFHLRRIMGNDTLTYEELSTILCKVEACLNSRPLCPMSMEPDDLEALTPGHFLIGEALNAIPEGAIRAPATLQTRFKLMQKLTNDLWRRWQAEYLSTLQAKTKWKYQLQPIKEGDLVVLKELHLPPQYWKLARVLSTSKDAAGQVRVAKLKTSKGNTSRAITQIVKLFSEDSNDDSVS